MENWLVTYGFNNDREEIKHLKWICDLCCLTSPHPASLRSFAHMASTPFLQLSLSLAQALACSHDLRPASDLFFSTFLRQVVLGRPTLRLPTRQCCCAVMLLLHSQHMSKPFPSSLLYRRANPFAATKLKLINRDNVWPLYLPSRNPACSGLSLVPVPFFILLMRILPSTLLATIRSVKPLQLLQSFKSPFLGIFTINPLNH